jgi:hypothetical protein
MPKISLDGFVRPTKEDERISLEVSSLFSTPTGQSVLKHLRSITIETVTGANASDAELRHLEGQRFLVGLIERRIKHAEKVKADE